MGNALVVGVVEKVGEELKKKLLWILTYTKLILIQKS
jgi:hypothetical protein